MGRIGLPELIVIAVILLLLFGAARLPQISTAIGKSIREFKKASCEKKNKRQREKNQ